MGFLQVTSGFLEILGAASHTLLQRYTFFFQAEDGIRDRDVTGVQTCALPISLALAASWYQLARQLRQKPAMFMRSMFCTSPRSRRCPTSRRKAAASSSVTSELSIFVIAPPRSEERRVGKECRSRWSPHHETKK